MSSLKTTPLLLRALLVALAVSPKLASASEQGARSRIVIHHHDEMGGSFRLIKATYLIDGVSILTKKHLDRLVGTRESDVHDGAIKTGPHSLAVTFTYEGEAGGALAHRKGYKLTIRANHVFIAEPGEDVSISVVIDEKGIRFVQASSGPKPMHDSPRPESFARQR